MRIKIKKISNKLKFTNFFVVDDYNMIYHPEVKKKVRTNEPIKLNLKNWEEHKIKFMTHRLEIQSEKGYTPTESIKLELDKTDSLMADLKDTSISKVTRYKEFETLINRYRDLLTTNNTKKN